MLRNYIKIAIRHLYKHQSYTMINLLGLSLGITCSLILFLLIRFWLSFDTYHAQADRIYRIVKETNGPNGRHYGSGAPVPLADAFRNDFPDVEKVAFVSALTYAGTLFTIEDSTGTPRSFQEEEHIAWIEPQFFEIFDRPFMSGRPSTALDEPNEVVLSRKYAQKYFGSQNPVGRTIQLNKEKELLVTGVMEDYPPNTDFPFDILIAYATIKSELEDDWGSTSSDDQVYVLLSEGQSAEEINARFPAFVSKYYGEEDAATDQIAHYLQPLRSMHFEPRFSTYGQSEIPVEIIWALSIIAAFLVFIACVNFINLATATSARRAREVGIRKVLGSTQPQLMKQFLGETAIITIFSILIALGLTELLLLRLNAFLDLSLQLRVIQDPVILLFLGCLALLISILSGLYPAWVLARFRPIQVLKNVLQKPATRKISLRKALIVFQFIIAQVFIIGTLILFRQIEYLQQADLGFQPEAIVTVRLPESTPERKKTLQTELQRLPGVQQVSLAYSSPASGWLSITSYQLEDDPQQYNTQLKHADRHYLDLFDIALVAGSGFTDGDTISRVIVNETFARKHGFSSPKEVIGKIVTLWDRKLPVAGVVKDFTTRSLRERIEPTLLVDNRNAYNLAAIKLAAGHTTEALQAIEKQWTSFYPEYTFDYQFVDEEIAEFYEGDKKLSQLISLASLVVIFIGCLGLYGLVTFMAEQKTKEVGVRKVMGASVGSIVRLFSREFIRLIVLAFVVAAPITYYVMSGWLQSFAFRIELGAGIFLAGMAATLLIALLTVSYRSVRAALANPVESLRNE